MSNNRFSNIELLRIVSMFMVILGHYYCQSAFPDIKITSLNQVFMQFLASGSKIAVDIFIIISGYFLVKQKFSWQKIVKFLTCTYFWSIIVLIFAIFVLDSNVNNSLIKKSLFPLTPLNWFARAYLNLYIVFPL